MKQAELLLCVFARYVHSNPTTQFKVAFDGFGVTHELAKRIGYPPSELSSGRSV